MQKNTKLMALTTMIAVISVFSLIITTNLEEDNPASPQEKIYQEVHASAHEYPLSVLSEGTKYAIIGKVIEIESQREAFDADMHTVFSYVTIKVKEDLFGAYDQKTITVKIRGGDTETMETIAEYSPDFTVGEKVLVFIPEKDVDSIYGDDYMVAGHYQGKYKLENEMAEREDNKNHKEKDLIIKIKEFRK